MSKSNKRSRRSRKSVLSNEINMTAESNKETFVYPTMSEEKWSELLKQDEEDKVYFKMISEMYKVTREEQKMEYIKQVAYPFTVMCCHVAWTKVLNMYFQRIDPGEKTEDITTEWKPEEEPSPPSPMDSWASWHLNIVPEPLSETLKEKDLVSDSKLEEKFEIPIPITETIHQVETHVRDKRTSVIVPPDVSVRGSIKNEQVASHYNRDSLKLSDNQGVLHGHHEEFAGLRRSYNQKSLEGTKRIRNDSLGNKDYIKSSVSAEKDELSEDSLEYAGVLLRDGKFDLQDEYGFSLVDEDFDNEVDDIKPK